MAATVIPLKLKTEETQVLPQVSTVQEVRDHPGSCFCELLPGSNLTAEALFPGHVAIRAGERGPPEWWSDHDSNIAALHLFKLRDVFLFPGFGVVITSAGDVMRLPMEDAAYYSPDLSALPGIAVEHGQTVFIEPEAIENLGRSALTMALGARVNYGHFVLDCLPATASIRNCGAFVDFPFCFPPLEPWQRRHLELLGVEPVELAGDVYRVAEIIYTSGMHHYLHTPNFNYQEVRAAQCAAIAQTPKTSPKRLYLSRGDHANRVMVSEQELRRRLSRLDFTTIDTGGITVDSQIALFKDAEVIIGSAGAAFANVLYCSPGALIIEIQPAGMENQWVRNICLQNRCRFVAYFCNILDGDRDKPQTNLTYDLDVDRFIAEISGHSPLDKQRYNPPWLTSLKNLAGLTGFLR